MNLRDANREFMKNPLFQYIGNGGILMGSLIIVITSLYFNNLKYILPALILVFLVLTISYLSWRKRYFSNIKTRCPQCHSLMNAICCEACQKHVPYLCLWLDGLFLSHCPYCGQKILSKEGSLLAICSNMHTQKNPFRIYKKPTFLTFYIVEELPEPEPIGKWEYIKTTAGNIMVYYYEEKNDKHSGNILYIISQYFFDSNPDPEALGFTLANLLIISNKVDNLRNDVIKGYFPDKKLTKIIEKDVF